MSEHVDLFLDVPPPEKGGPSREVLDDIQESVNEEVNGIADQLEGGTPADHWDEIQDDIRRAAAWMYVFAETVPGPTPPVVQRLVHDLCYELVILRMSDEADQEPTARWGVEP